MRGYRAIPQDYFGRAIVENWGLILDGYRMTVIVSALSLVLSMLLGTLVAGLRTGALWPLRVLATAYVECFRNTPLLIQIYFYFFGLPKLGIRLDAFQVGIVAMSVYHGAYVSEVVRSGIRAIDAGQLEAARSLGLSYLQSMRFIVLPQAVRMVIPPLGTLSIALVKNSSLLYAVSLGELLFVATLLESRTFRTFEIFTALIVFYLSLTVPLALLVNWLERRTAVVR